MSFPIPVARVLRFDIFELDVRAGELRKGGVKLRLQGQPLQVLETLLKRAGDVVTHEELRAQIWPADTFVDFDHSLHNAISRIRDALGDSAETPRYIETVPRRGYRFIARVESQASAPHGSNVIPAGSSSFGATAAATQVVSRVFFSRFHGRRAKLLALAFVVGIALVFGLSLSSLRKRLRGRPSPPRIESLAVLPLVNLSGDPEQDFFADGMTEALITDLGKIGALRVISRTSVMQYKGTKKPLPEIARELKVDGLIEGTVTRSANHLRITANLLRASPEKHLWAESYESEVGDILTLQGQVAQAVAREIQVKLTPEQQKLLGNARPVNPKAHDDYLKGRYLCDKDTREGLDKAIQYFQQAIDEAPTDPFAYAGLANCYVVWGWAGDIFAGDLSPREIMPKARDAALRALQLDEDLAEAHTALADVELIFNHNWSGAEREFKRAIELNPSNSPAHAWYAHYLVAMGRVDDATTEARRSLELDPFSIFTMDFAQWPLYLARRYDLSVQQSRKSLEFAPEFPWAHYELGEAYERTGRVREAIQEFMKAEELLGMSQDRLAELRKAYQQSGEKGYWRRSLAFCREASKQARKFASTSGYGSCDYIQNADLAAMQVRLGEFNAAFESLERGYTKHEAGLLYLKVDPRWDDLRSDPRFQDLIRRVGLTN